MRENLTLRRQLTLPLLLVLAGLQASFGQIPADIQRFRSDAFGASNQLREVLLSGNRIKTLAYNDGQIARWQFEPSLRWPDTLAVSYLTGHTLLVAAEITAPGTGQKVHPVQTAYREFVDVDPISGQPWTFTPLPGYHRADRPSPTIASSWDATTWPAAWPAALGLPSSANGAWYSHEDASPTLGTREIMFVMDDARDQEWTRVPYRYYPVLSDSSRGGLGLRVEARAFQWADSIARDMLFLHYDIWNLSDFDYAAASVGFLSDPSIGPLDAGDDCAVYDSAHGVAYVYDPNGVPVPTQTSSGYLGYVMLAFPGSARLPVPASPGGVAFFPSSSTQWYPRDDESVWQAMATGRMDTSITNSDVVLIISGGTFEFPKWTKASFAMAFVFADSIPRLMERAAVARAIAANGYALPPTTSAHVDGGEVGAAWPQNFSLDAYPNPFNPTTTIRYALPRASHVSVAVYNLLGERVAVLMDGMRPAGVHQVGFDGAGLASGMYVCQLMADGSRRSAKLILSR